MKNIQYRLIILLGLSVIFASCGGGGGSESPTPPASELVVPKILSPKKDAVCEGKLEKAGSYTVNVRSSAVFGASKYVFSLYDASGKKLKDAKSTSNEGSFSSVAAGHAYTVMVKVLNSGGSKESVRIPFSTPGLKVVDYVPVVKTAVYDAATTSLKVVFHDKESNSKDLLTYSVYYSLTKRFGPQDKQLLFDKEKASSDKLVVIDLSKANGAPYYRLEVKDIGGNMSSYDVHIIK